MKKKLLWGLLLIGVIVLVTICNYGCGGTGKGIGDDTIITPPVPKPLNLSIFVDLSDRIQKEKDHLLQADKDQHIINGIAEMFIEKQKKEGFQKSEDKFRVVFYPAPDGAYSLADSLTLNMNEIEGPKKRPLGMFQKTHAKNIKALYDSALQESDYFGSDIWGFFSKDKVKDLCSDGYRNVLIILSDGYLYDAHNKLAEGNTYSYILPQTLANEGSRLIPCKISNPDLEIYFIECNANPQTDYPKMKEILETWFSEMGIKTVDIQDTDIPSNTLKHLKDKIFRAQQ